MSRPLNNKLPSKGGLHPYIDPVSPLRGHDSTNIILDQLTSTDENFSPQPKRKHEPISAEDETPLPDHFNAPVTPPRKIMHFSRENAWGRLKDTPPKFGVKLDQLPSPKVAIFNAHMRTMKSIDRSNELSFLSPGNSPTHAKTPGGTQFIKANSVLLGNAKAIFYVPVVPAKFKSKTPSEKNRLKNERNLRKLPAAPEEAIKEIGPFVLTANIIRQWENKKRNPPQNKVMGNLSAWFIAKCHTLYDKTHPNWEWLHLAAHGFGGGDARDPQVVANLVAGIGEENSGMMTLEEAIREWLRENPTTQLTLYVRATLIPHTHIATRIDYFVRCHDREMKTSFFPTQPAHSVTRGSGHFFSGAIKAHFESSEDSSLPTKSSEDDPLSPEFSEESLLSAESSEDSLPSFAN